MRSQVTHSGAAAQGGKSGGQGQGTSKALTTFIDPSLSWDDLPFFKSITKMKIVLKGIATAEDAVRAYKEVSPYLFHAHLCFFFFWGGG